MSNLFAKDALAVPFELLRMTDVESVGGKNASLGEMISQLPQGVRVPTGFATTAHGPGYTKPYRTTNQICAGTAIRRVRHADPANHPSGVKRFQFCLET